MAAWICSRYNWAKPACTSAGNIGNAAALALAATCAGELAPGITTDTASWSSSQRSAICAIVIDGGTKRATCSARSTPVPNSMPAKVSDIELRAVAVEVAVVVGAENGG